MTDHILSDYEDITSDFMLKYLDFQESKNSDR